MTLKRIEGVLVVWAWELVVSRFLRLSKKAISFQVPDFSNAKSYNCFPGNVFRLSLISGDFLVKKEKGQTSTEVVLTRPLVPFRAKSFRYIFFRNS